jgi:hypothetical protein
LAEEDGEFGVIHVGLNVAFIVVGQFAVVQKTESFNICLGESSVTDPKSDLIDKFVEILQITKLESCVSYG